MSIGAFDANGWNYACGAEQQIELAYRLGEQKQLTGALVDRFLAMRRFGGKAFGLALCEVFAACWKRLSFSPPLHVPPWFPLSLRDLRLFGSGWQTERQNMLLQLVRRCPDQLFALRSSAEEEDWCDAESGRHTSEFVHGRDFVDPWHIRHVFSKISVPTVVQEKASGTGVVIDIAWSVFFERVVARVAWGREYADGTGSSPTWDNDAPMAVFDAVTGEELIPFYSSALYEPFRNDGAGLFARSLYRVFKALGWEYGVQCEFVAGRHATALVQIRPSPGFLRRDESCSFPLERPLFVSPRVNRSFCLRGRSALLRDDDFSPFGEKGEDLARAFLRGRPVDMGNGPLRGTIGVWPVRLPKGHSSRIVWAAAACGAIGQIGTSLFSNTSHECPIRAHETEIVFRREAMRSCALLGFAPSALCRVNGYSFSEALRRHQGETLIVSDGIVGAAYLV